MKRVFSILYMICCCTLESVDVQSVGISEVLEGLQMENISVAQRQDTITAAFEISVYRGSYNDISIAIRRLITLPEVSTLRLVILDNALPQLCITLPAKLVENYQSGKCDLDGVYCSMQMTTSTKTAMEALEGTERESATFGKVDVVVYPGVILANNVAYKLYRAAFELQPAVETQLWRGASLRLQVCLSIVNNEPGRWDCIRLGYLTLRQEFRLDNHWRGCLIGGNFSDDRRGLTAGIGYFSSDGHQTVEGENGIISSSHLYGNDWGMSKWKRMSGQLSVGYFIPQVDIQLEVNGRRFMYGDYGVCGILSRYFGEYVMGFCGMYTDGETNAGFHFSIPLPGKKRSRHAVHVMLPDYLAFQYDMRSRNEFAHRALGVSYRTELKSTENSRFWQSDYIRYYLIRTNKRTKLK